MKKHYALFILFFSCCMSIVNAQENQSLRIIQDLNFGWKFFLGDAPEAAQPTFDDSSWRTVDLPHDFQIEQPWVAPSADEKADNTNEAANIRSRLSSRGFKEMGKGWYRLHITPNNALKGKRLLLDFGGIMYVGDVYLNGELIGQTNYGYVGFDIDITKKIKFGQENVISIVSDTREPNNSRWYTGGGLFRSVKLIATDTQKYFTRNPLYITTKDNREVTIGFESACYGKNLDEITVGVKIIDPDGNVVDNHKEQVRRNKRLRVQELKLQPISLPNAKLWDCETPNLYTAELTLYNENGEPTDNVSTHFGVRTIEIGPDFGLKLNGKKVLLKGIANHHTLGALGAAAYPSAIEKRILLIKSFGCNHIRTSHNPYSREFIELCDKHGILVVDELYDKWTTQHTGGRVDWKNLWQDDIPEWIKRDRNSPSVVLWSLGNELQQEVNQPFNDWGVTCFKLQKTLLNRYDTTRLVTVAMHPRFRNWDTDSLPADLAMHTDIQAYNYRYMYFPGDGRRFPWMTFYQSEAAMASMGPNFYEMNLNKVIGLAYWGAIDYLGESQGWPTKGWAQGCFDISLEAKPKAYLMKSIFSDEPVVHIAVIDKKGDIMWNGVQTGNDGMSDHWNRADGSKLNIITYTNADEVELVINGKSFGKQKNNFSDPKQRNQIRWNDVPYAKGYAEAIARKNGKIVARHKIETSGEPKKLSLTAESSEWKADGYDLQHVRVTCLDSKGRRVPFASQNVTFKVISGDARIVVVSSGNHESDELNATDARKLFNGSALVILRAGKQSGQVVLQASAEGLKTQKIVLSTK